MTAIKVGRFKLSPIFTAERSNDGSRDGRPGASAE